MRTVLIVIATLLVFTSSAQQDSISSMPSFDKEHYLKLSRQQKAFGIITRITGSASVALGGLIWIFSPIAGISGQDAVKNTRQTGIFMVVGGSGLIAVSVALFNQSVKNKEKAKLYSSTNSIYFPSHGTVRQLTVGVKIPIH